MKAGGNGEAGCGSLVVSLGSVGLTSAQLRLSWSTLMLKVWLSWLT
jgi:hypothetical protein